MERDEHAVIISSDPGPVSSAVTATYVTVDRGVVEMRILGAWYLTNLSWAEPFPYPWVSDVLDHCKNLGTFFFAYERVRCSYGSNVGATVMDTATMSGDLRRAFRPHVSGIYAIASSDWRHALTGQGNARTPQVKGSLHEFFEGFGGGADAYKGTKKQPGPWWPIVLAGAKRPGDKGSNIEHLIDALGVAAGLTRMRFRSGKDPEIYRTF